MGYESPMLRHLLIAALAAVTAAAGAVGPAREKVILDTDFTTAGDDGMVGIMAAQLHAEGVIPLRVALLDSSTRRPAVRLAIAGRQDDAWYQVGEIAID